MRYLSILKSLININIQRELEYRSKFVIWIILEIFWIVWFIAIISVLYRFTDQIVGWTRAEVFVYLGFYKFLKGAFDVLFYSALISFPESVSRGELDFTLTRPVNSQFLVSFRYIYFSDTIQLLLGLLMILYGQNQLGTPFSLPSVILSLLASVSGITLLYSLSFIGSIISVFAIRLTALSSYHEVLKNAIRYPADIFYRNNWLIDTLAFFLSLFVTLPAGFLIQKYSGLIVIPQILISLALFLGVSRLWKHSLRHYSSASS